jgi:hypothetical protein
MRDLQGRSRVPGPLCIRRASLSYKVLSWHIPGPRNNFQFKRVVVAVDGNVSGRVLNS